MSEQEKHVTAQEAFQMDLDTGVYGAMDIPTRAVVFKAFQRAWDSQQARIDQLMLEWCPDEMSDAQFKQWASHQKPVAVSGHSVGEKSQKMTGQDMKALWDGL